MNSDCTNSLNAKARCYWLLWDFSPVFRGLEKPACFLVLVTTSMKLLWQRREQLILFGVAHLYVTLISCKKQPDLNVVSWFKVNMFARTNPQTIPRRFLEATLQTHTDFIWKVYKFMMSHSNIYFCVTATYILVPYPHQSREIKGKWAPTARFYGDHSKHTRRDARSDMSSSSPILTPPLPLPSHSAPCDERRRVHFHVITTEAWLSHYVCPLSCVSSCLLDHWFTASSSPAVWVWVTPVSPCDHLQ